MNKQETNKSTRERIKLLIANFIIFYYGLCKILTFGIDEHWAREIIPHIQSLKSKIKHFHFS
jgi:hypothetical protein